jgi:hypothetical protein
MSKQMRWMWSIAVLVVVASACERRITVYVDEVVPSGAAGSGTGSAGAGAAGEGAAAGGVAGATGAAGAASGAAGAAVQDGGAGNDASPACTVDTDCPAPDSTCALSRCAAGRCTQVDAPSGAKVPDVPADCHASTCDAHGHATANVVDVTNVPLSNDPCAVVGCTAFGDTLSKPVATGTACRVGARKGTCDGAGSCVECTRTADCPPGLFCDAHHFCGSAPCTDVDCGGACGPCGLGKRCLADSDCQSFACDAATTTCVQNQCLDHRQDGDETDADCGGGTCQGCGFGQACLLDDDCKNQACDALTLRCVSSQCIDHRTDGNETDVDCGGIACGPCGPGRGCASNFDCQSGHTCNASKVCQ